MLGSGSSRMGLWGRVEDTVYLVYFCFESLGFQAYILFRVQTSGFEIDDLRLII